MYEFVRKTVRFSKLISLAIRDGVNVCKRCFQAGVPPGKPWKIIPYMYVIKYYVTVLSNVLCRYCAPQAIFLKCFILTKCNFY